MISVRHIKKIYRDNEQIICPFDDLSFEIEQGLFFSICGASGSGKSTLLQLISGLDRPDSGEVFYCGVSIHQLSKTQLADLRLNSFGFIFQTPHFIPYKTVLENVLLPSYYARVSNKSLLVKRAIDLLDYVGLDQFQTRNPSSLSGGELQRMVFARALLMEPEVIFADEPTASLDQKNAERLLNLLTEQRDKGKTIVMVTHDPMSIEYSDQVLDLEALDLNGSHYADA